MKNLLQFLAVLLFQFGVVNALAKEQGNWNFRVLLDDTPIGTHEFSVTTEDSQLLVNSRADFEYRLLFVKLYEYLHEANETWRDGCLVGIESQTDANGKDYAVSGRLEDGKFLVGGSAGSQELPPCVKTFAYWNPQFLNEARLLNSQDGEYLDVSVSGPDQVLVEVRGIERQALSYRLKADKLDIQLWYSPENEWLGLVSKTDSGRLLRYELL